jgi:hypothetical protein
MSALIVKGKIVGKIVKKDVKKKNGEGTFDIATYYVANGGEGAPVEVRSFDLSKKTGADIEIPVYVKAWRGEKSYGANINEISTK